MKFITHEYKWFCEDENTEITHITFMDSKGRGKGRLYLFNDDSVNAYMDCLTVTEKYRKQGIGLALQKCREDLAIRMGYKTITLWVEDNTWQKEWYIRRGFKYLKDYEDNRIYMRKPLTIKD